jgi:hypothetical protein
VFEIVDVSLSTFLAFAGFVSVFAGLLFFVANLTSSKGTEAAAIRSGTVVVLGLLVGITSGAVTNSGLQSNISSVESFLENRYSGEFEVDDDKMDRSELFDAFNDWDDIKEKKVTVTRELDGKVYSYLLNADDEGQPALLEVVSGTVSAYPPLTK